MTGPLKDSEKKFIQENCLTLSDQEIANNLGRDRRTIASYRTKELGIKKGLGGKVQKIETFNDIGEKTSEDIEELLNPGQKVEYHKMQLRNSLYYDVLKDQLSKDELDYYTEAWGDLSEQFADVFATEKRQIDELIRAEIMGNRILKSVKIVEDELLLMQDRVDEFRKGKDLHNDEEARENDDILMSMAHRLAAASNAMSNDYQKTVDLRRRIIEDLNARRRDRVEQIQKVGSTFLSLVEAFKDDNVRKTQGKQMELMKLSRDKKLSEWRQASIFPDGAKDSILLDDKTEIAPNASKFIQEHVEPDLLNNPKDIDKELQHAS